MKKQNLFLEKPYYRDGGNYYERPNEYKTLMEKVCYESRQTNKSIY